MRRHLGISNDIDEIYHEWCDGKARLDKEFPHQIKVPGPIWHYSLEMNNLGIKDGKWSWHHDWETLDNILGFKKKDHLVIFKLRFGGTIV